jgi:hypothetical protein
MTIIEDSLAYDASHLPAPMSAWRGPMAMLAPPRSLM